MAVVASLVEQITVVEAEANRLVFGQHSDPEIITSQPGLDEEPVLAVPELS